MFRFSETTLNMVGLILFGVAICELISLGAHLLAEKEYMGYGRRPKHNHSPAIFLWSTVGWTALCVLVAFTLATLFMGKASSFIVIVMSMAGFVSAVAIISILLLRLRFFFPPDTFALQSWAGIGASLVIFDFVLVITSISTVDVLVEHEAATLNPFNATLTANPHAAEIQNILIREALFTALESAFYITALFTFAWKLVCAYRKPPVPVAEYADQTGASKLAAISQSPTFKQKQSASFDDDESEVAPGKASARPASASTATIGGSDNRAVTNIRIRATPATALPPLPPHYAGSGSRHSSMRTRLIIRFIVLLVLNLTQLVITIVFLTGAGDVYGTATDYIHILVYATELSVISTIRTPRRVGRNGVPMLKTFHTAQGTKAIKYSTRSNSDDDDDDEEDDTSASSDAYRHHAARSRPAPQMALTAASPPSSRLAPDAALGKGGAKSRPAVSTETVYSGDT
ncbi:hypothetical protein BC831DRAFT_470876 [Entophlyctis helioformis]|nr:hypothetical protein BC831DRAFT_470876 [Entophlyctis helioformis]